MHTEGYLSSLSSFQEARGITNSICIFFGNLRGFSFSNIMRRGNVQVIFLHSAQPILLSSFA